MSFALYSDLKFDVSGLNVMVDGDKGVEGHAQGRTER